ncbi:MAG: hypothetical protein AB1742_07490 [bacterium]
MRTEHSGEAGAAGEEQERNGAPLAGDDPRATLFRLLAFLCQIAYAYAAVGALRPRKRELRAAFAAGVNTALFDFFLESLAYGNDLWYCGGGIQKIRVGGREFDFLHVPIDMVAGFVLTGMTFSLASDAPRLLRRRSVLLRPLFPPALDAAWKNSFAVGAALTGAAGDFLSKKWGVWRNAPEWTFPLCAFAAWLPLIALTLFTYDSLKK